MTSTHQTSPQPTSTTPTHGTPPVGRGDFVPHFTPDRGSHPCFILGLTYLVNTVKALMGAEQMLPVTQAWIISIIRTHYALCHWSSLFFSLGKYSGIITNIPPQKLTVIICQPFPVLSDFLDFCFS